MQVGNALPFANVLNAATKTRTVNLTKVTKWFKSSEEPLRTGCSTFIRNDNLSMLIITGN